MTLLLPEAFPLTSLEQAMHQPHWTSGFSTHPSMALLPVLAPYYSKKQSSHPSPQPKESSLLLGCKGTSCSSGNSCIALTSLR